MPTTIADYTRDIKRLFYLNVELPNSVILSTKEYDHVIVYLSGNTDVDGYLIFKVSLMHKADDLVDTEYKFKCIHSAIHDGKNDRQHQSLRKCEN